jgi:hypothetical protein
MPRRHCYTGVVGVIAPASLCYLQRQCHVGIVALPLLFRSSLHRHYCASASLHECCCAGVVAWKLLPVPSIAIVVVVSAVAHSLPWCGSHYCCCASIQRNGMLLGTMVGCWWCGWGLPKYRITFGQPYEHDISCVLGYFFCLGEASAKC